MRQGNTRKLGARRRRPVGALVALLALAGAAQILAPASASALINQSGDGACVAIAGMPWAGWNGSEFCVPDGGGSEGSGGEATGSGSEPGAQPGEVIEVTGTAPSRCQVYPSECLPSQVGGRQQGGVEHGFQARSPKPTRPAKPKEARPGLSLRQLKCNTAYKWLVNGVTNDHDPLRGNRSEPWYKTFQRELEIYHRHPTLWRSLTPAKRSQIDEERRSMERDFAYWSADAYRIDSEDTGCKSILHKDLP
jgi:hypothetical protein